MDETLEITLKLPDLTEKARAYFLSQIVLSQLVLQKNIMGVVRNTRQLKLRHSLWLNILHSP